MIGASGSVLGLVGACAVAAPQAKVVLFLVFPVRIRTLAIVVAVFSTLMVFGAQETERADACHLGGLAFGALWVWMEIKGLVRLPGRVAGSVGPSGRKWVQVKTRKGAWDRKLKRQRDQQAQIDRILKKIHEKGLASLSRSEKKLLQQASQQSSQQD